FGGFLAEFDGQAFGDTWSKFFEHLFFGQVLAEIDSGGGSRRKPEFAAFVGTGGLKSIKKAKALNETERDDGEKACVGNQSDHATETEAGAFSESETLCVANHDRSDEVETFDRNVIHIAKIGNVQAMLARQIGAKIFRIDFNGAKSLQKTKTQKALERRAGRI